MKRLIFLAGILATATASATQYFGIHAGTSHKELTNESDSGLKVGMRAGAKYGYVFDSGLRGELELSYRVNHFKTRYAVVAEDQLSNKAYRSMHSWSYMANVLYDVKQLTVMSVTPYVGAGIGYAQNTEKLKLKATDLTHEIKERDNRFAWQAIVGAKYPINETLSAGLEYNYFCGQSHAKDHSMSMTLVRSF